MRRSVLISGLFSLTLLLVGSAFAPAKSYAFELTGPSLSLFLLEGLTFQTVPQFETISFSTSSDSIHEIHIDTIKYEEVKLEEFNFSSFESTTDTTPSENVIALAPTLTPSPTISPSPTTTLTPIPTVIVTSTPTPTMSPVPTMTPMPTIVPSPTPVGDEIWDKLALCEAGGNWGIDTGNGYFGGLQFSQSAWESVGGNGSPASASREEQIEKGKKLQAARGWGAWGACAKKLNLL